MNKSPGHTVPDATGTEPSWIMEFAKRASVPKHLVSGLGLAYRLTQLFEQH